MEALPQWDAVGTCITEHPLLHPLPARVPFGALRSWVAGEMPPHGEQMPGAANVSQVHSKAEKFWRCNFQHGARKMDWELVDFL